VIQKRPIAIADTRAPAIATPPPHVLNTDSFRDRYHGNRIPLVGHHHGARRSVSPGLYDIESVSICGEIFENERHTLTPHCSPFPSPTTTFCYKGASGQRSIGIDGSVRIRNNGSARKCLLEEQSRGSGKTSGRGVYCGQTCEGARVVDTCTISSRNVSMSVKEWKGLG
jgi:hypothetical protein